MPLAYSEMTTSDSPSSRRLCLGTVFGSKRPRSVARHLQLDGADLRRHALARRAVSRIAAPLLLCMLGIPKMLLHFGLEARLQHLPHQLRQEPALTRQVDPVGLRLRHQLRGQILHRRHHLSKLGAWRRLAPSGATAPPDYLFTRAGIPRVVLCVAHQHAPSRLPAIRLSRRSGHATYTEVRTHPRAVVGYSFGAGSSVTCGVPPSTPVRPSNLRVISMPFLVISTSTRLLAWFPSRSLMTLSTRWTSDLSSA